MTTGWWLLRLACVLIAGAGGRARADEPTAAAALDHARAERLELGGHVAVNVLLFGAPRADWVAAAGGATPPRELLWPLEGGQIARAFGSGWRGEHRALDIMADRGTPIRAVAPGIVAYSSWGVQGYGGLVLLVHAGGWMTLYAHASALLVRPGHLVARGDTIARVGRTGNANGEHLHFELRRAGERVDPAPLFVDVPAGVTVPCGPARLNDATFLWRVRRGQTLRFIAHRAGVDAAAIRALNDLPDGAPLTPGRHIVVPRLPTTPPPPAPARRHGAPLVP